MDAITSFLIWLAEQYPVLAVILTAVSLLVAAASFIVGLLPVNKDSGFWHWLIKLLNFISIVNPKNVTVVPKETANAGQTENNF